MFNQEIDLSNLSNLRELIFGHCAKFNQEIDLSNLTKLTYLSFGDHFNEKILNVPESLEKINLPMIYDRTRITEPHLRRLLEL